MDLNVESIRGLLSAGGPVLIILIILSFVSLALIAERFCRIRSSINYSRELIEFCRHSIHSRNYTKIADTCKKKSVRNTPAGVLLARLVKEHERPIGELEKIADSVIDFEVAQLQRRLTVLGTLGSTTPFIGLFGTVVGVMHAFKDLASNAAANGAGASIVAAGISEALVNTAAGLLVAIPAVIAYNYFLSKTSYFSQELEKAAQDFIYSTKDTDEIL